MIRLFATVFLIFWVPIAANAGISPQYDLLKAVERQNVEEVKKLLRSGVSPNTRLRSSGDPALVIAARKGNREIMEILLKAGANPDIATRDGKSTPLIIRSTVGDVLGVQLLLNYKADVNGGRRTLGAPLIEAVRGKKYKVAKILIDAGAKSNIGDVTGQTALDYAHISRSKRMIKMIESAEAKT